MKTFGAHLVEYILNGGSIKANGGFPPIKKKSNDTNKDVKDKKKKYLTIETVKQDNMLDSLFEKMNEQDMTFD